MNFDSKLNSLLSNHEFKAVVYHGSNDPNLTVDKIRTGYTSPKAWGTALYCSPHRNNAAKASYVYEVSISGNYLIGKSDVNDVLINKLINTYPSFKSNLQEVIENEYYLEEFFEDDLYLATGNDVLFALSSSIPGGRHNLREHFLNLGIDGIHSAHTHYGLETIIYNYHSITGFKRLQ